MRWLLGLVMLLMLVPSRAAEFGLYYADDLSTEDEKPFTLITARLGTELPWRWSLANGWAVNARMDIALGRLAGNGRSAITLGLGPALRIIAPSAKWYVTLGWRPTYLERSRFGDIDLGGSAQFETALGAGYWLTERLSVSYDLFHMSNGGLDSPNPGWNGQRLGLSYGF